MKSLKPILKGFCLLLILVIILHTILSFFDCVLIEKGNHFHDLEVSEETEGLMEIWVLICTCARIYMLLTSKKGLHILSGIISAFVAITTSSLVFLECELMRPLTGLAWTNYTLTPLGQQVLSLSWVVVAIHSLFLLVLYCPQGMLRNKNKS